MSNPKNRDRSGSKYSVCVIVYGKLYEMVEGIPHCVLHKAVPTQPSAQKGDRLTFPGCAFKRRQD